MQEIQEEEKRIRIDFINPVTKRPDEVYVREIDIESLRHLNTRGVACFSFFQTISDKSFIVNIYLDKQNNVRAAEVSEFFLKINNKLFK